MCTNASRAYIPTGRGWVRVDLQLPPPQAWPSVDLPFFEKQIETCEKTGKRRLLPL